MPSGYAWWYVDALSDDGKHGITLIGFVGSVFSPYYAWGRQHGRPDPEAHCAVNVALYGDIRRWAMTERGSAQVQRSEHELIIGPSALRWEGDALVVTIDERTMPYGGRLRGIVRVRPQALTHQVFTLDPAGLHRWAPIAPRCIVDVMLEHPRLAWSGRGYFDSNNGDMPLEKSFANWHWSRAAMCDGTAILYEISPLAGRGTSLALHIDHAGEVTRFTPPASVSLPRSRWGIARETRAEKGGARVRQTLEDTPFYARSVLDTHLRGEPVTAMHESLSLTRFRTKWVQAMLPFRMPRVAR